MASITKVMTFYTSLVYLEEYNLNGKLINVKIPSLVEEIEGMLTNLLIR